MKQWIGIGLVILLAAGSFRCGEAAPAPAAESGDGSAGSGGGSGSGAEVADFGLPGPYRVGVQSLAIDDPSRSRSWTAEVWYPTDAEGSGSSVLAFATGDEERALFERLYASAPVTCATQTTRAIRNAAPRPNERMPVVFFSHCHGCTRFDLFTVAEHLASYGVAVVAPDHAGNTLFAHSTGAPAPINAAFLETRVEDMLFTARQALDSSGPFANSGLHFDPERVGVMGHSFGAATAAWTRERLGGVRGVFAVAAPMESPLLPGPTMGALPLPTLFLLAKEDNSITELGNRFIRNNHAAASSPSWLVEMSDAGHWSPSDICGLDTPLMAGCGEGRRMTGRAPFTYVDNASARRATAAIAVAFFSSTLAGDESATGYLNRGSFGLSATLSKR